VTVHDVVVQNFFALGEKVTKGALKVRQFLNFIQNQLFEVQRPKFLNKTKILPNIGV